MFMSSDELVEICPYILVPRIEVSESHTMRDYYINHDETMVMAPLGYLCMFSLFLPPLCYMCIYSLFLSIVLHQLSSLGHTTIKQGPPSRPYISIQSTSQV